MLVIAEKLRRSGNMTDCIVGCCETLRNPRVQFSFLIVSSINSPCCGRVTNGKSGIFLLPSCVGRPLGFFSLVFSVFGGDRCSIIRYGIIGDKIPILTTTTTFGIPVHVLRDRTTRGNSI